jgi:acyl-CoA thioesterase
VADPDAGGASVADRTPADKFDRDTAVTLRDRDERRADFAADVSADWRAGRGPHGGYLAAMILRALTDTIAEPERAPRSLTIHFARAPEPGPATIAVTVERAGRSLSTLSARLEQEGRLRALALAAFSVPWLGPEINELPMPSVAAPDPAGELRAGLIPDAPPIARRIRLQPRFGGRPLSGAEQPMELGGWLALAEPRPLDALALAFFSDALIPTPFMRLAEPIPVPTVDLTIHFRASLPRSPDPDPEERCLVRVKAGVIQEGFFEEDTTMWAADGTVLAQSRQLAVFIGR